MIEIIVFFFIAGIAFVLYNLIPNDVQTHMIVTDMAYEALENEYLKLSDENRRLKELLQRHGIKH